MRPEVHWDPTIMKKRRWCCIIWLEKLQRRVKHRMTKTVGSVCVLANLLANLAGSITFLVAPSLHTLTVSILQRMGKQILISPCQ